MVTPYTGKLYTGIPWLRMSASLAGVAVVILTIPVWAPPVAAYSVARTLCGMAVSKKGGDS